MLKNVHNISWKSSKKEVYFVGVKIGIPSALYDYDYNELWSTFFLNLGAEVINSGETNRTIMDHGINNCVAEACLPVKIYHGHVISLIDKVDYLFIPRYTSVSTKKYICPEVGGLPDLVRNSIPNLPEIIDVNINMYKKNDQDLEAAYIAGGYICDDKFKIYKAYKKSLEQYKRYLVNNEKYTILHDSSSQLHIGLIGHSYLLMDTYLNMDIASKLNSMGVSVTMPKDRNTDELRQLGDDLPKKMFWEFGAIAIGFARKMIQEKADGILFISSFGCGVDAFINYIVEHEAQASGMPYCLINIDEHSGEAGIETRLEAFIDMIKRRDKSYGNNISAHRQCLYNG